MKRLLLAFLVAPLLPAVIHATMGDSEYHPLALFLVVAIALYALQAVAGIPGYLFLRRAGRHGLRTYALFGFCVGAAPPCWLSGCISAPAMASPGAFWVPPTGGSSAR